MAQAYQTPVEKIRSMLSAWLNREDWQVQSLVRWMQYIDLPPLGHDDEPYIWILRGLVSERRGLRRVMASRVAEVLDEKPDINLLGSRPEQVLYNLLSISAGLKCAKELAEPLYRMFKRKSLKGQWQGVDLRSCLRAALSANQIDNRLQKVWEAMLHKRGNEWLLGSKYDGYNGIISMRCPEDPEKPYIDAVGEALKVMADHLKKQHDIRIEFRRLINKAIDQYPEHLTWNIDLLMQAHKNHWPTIGIECLPSLYFPLRNEEVGKHSFILWRHIFSVVRTKYNCELEAVLCNEQVYQVNLPPEASQIVDYIAPKLENSRLNNPFPTEQSMVKVIVNILSEIESDLQYKYPETASTIHNVRLQALSTVLD